MKQRDNIKEELKNIAPRLSEISTTNPFGVPQDYFESLPGDVLNNIKRQNDLVESLKGKVGNDTTNPFKVPGGYFELLPEVVMQTVKSEPKVIALTPSRSKELLSVAAAVAAVLMVAFSLLQPDNIQSVNTPEVVTAESLNDVSNDELYGYLSEDVNGWHVEEVAAGLSEAKLDTLENELVAVQSVNYDEAWMDLSQLDIESFDIESM